MSARVGMDLVAVASIEASIRAHGDRYLRRVYTAGELDHSRRGHGLDARRLAACFAAKEATLKVLRPRDEGIPWSAIEVRRDPSGWVEVELSGPAQTLAADAGVTDLSLSISHEGGFATAVVIASCSQGMPTSVR